MLTPQEVRTIVRAKNTRFATVTFVKVNGDKRTINGLFRPTSKILGTGKKTPDHLIPIWSPRDGWRSFREDAVVEIK
jgi:hypothetical protein